MIPFVNLANPLPTTPGTGLTAGQEAALTTATRRQPVASIAALKALTPSAGDAVNTLGYYAAGDGGGGVFYYDGTSVAVDNGGTIIAPNAGSGRWLRVYSGPLSVKCFGATGDGVTDDTAAFVAATSAINNISVPAGTFLINSLDINRNISIAGSGRKSTKIIVASYGTYTTTPYGILCRGSTNMSGLVSLSGAEIEVTSLQSGQVGVMITRKVHMSDIYVRGAPRDGIYFRSVNASNEAPFFCHLDKVWSKSNGRDGCRVTENCNANIFVHCQFDSNGAHGWHQVAESNGQPAGLYNNILIAGQASYNQNHGVYVENGSHLQLYGTYTEYNSQADGGNPKTGAYNNLQLGVNVTRSNIVLGEQGTDTGLSDCVGLNTVTGNNVSVGGSVLTASSGLSLGYQNVSSGRSITFEGAPDCQHTVLFREALADRNRLRYDGASNSLLIEGWSGSGWVEVQRITTSGALGFFGSAGVPKPTVTGSRGGNAALSSLITALSSLGLVTDSSS